MIYDSILQTIGNTPVVRLNRMAPDHVEMFVKVESFNPLASVKDRLAYAIITDAMQKGELKAGDTVQFSGDYEWNPRGGVIHWTHHDPAGRHPSGWVKYKGQTYQ